MGAHLAAEVHQDQSATLEPSEQRLQGRELDVPTESAVVAGALAEKDVDAARQLEEAVHPRRVAAVEYARAAGVEAQRERDLVLLMRHADGQDLDVGDRRALLGYELAKAELERHRFGGDVAVQQAKERPHPLLDPRRTENQERAGTRPLEHVLEQQKRQPAVMVTVKMADDHKIDIGGIEALSLQRVQHGRTAIEEKGRA